MPVSAPFLLGLTGSIAMGKSTTSDIFRKHRIPVLDSDHVVHRLYSNGGAAVPLVEAAFPGVTVDNSISRELLSKHVVGNQEALKELEAIVHPLVRQEKVEFIKQAIATGQPLIVLDVPLLFEAGYEKDYDAVAVVSAPADVQRQRALKRPGMAVDKFESILARQLPDEEKRKRANYIIDTGISLEETEAQVVKLIEQLVHLQGTAYLSYITSASS